MMRMMTSRLALVSALLTGSFAGAAHAQSALPEQSAPQSAPDQSAPDQSAPEQSAPDQSAPAGSAASFDQSAASREIVTVTGQEVAASQQAVSAVEFGNMVQVVTAEDILQSGSTNFAEAMQFLVKGVNIGYSPDEGEYTIRLDGGGDRDTLVILDGVPTYDRGPALEDIWGATTIDPHMIERVEVFRGGNSLFYGSNGGVGVVSIVTKAPDGTTKGEFGVNYGSFDTRELWGNYSFPLDADGNHSLMVYGSMQETDGPRIFNPALFVDNVAIAGGIQHYPLNRNNIGIKYLWTLDDSARFRANAQYTEVVFQDPFPNAEVYSENTVRYPIMDASLDKRWNDALFTEVQVYYSNPQLWNTELFPEVCVIPAGCVDPNSTTTPRRVIPYGAWTGAVEPFGNKGFGYSNQRTGAYKEMGATVRNTLSLGEWLETVLGVQWVQYQDASDPEYIIPDQDNQVTGVFADFRPRLPFSPDTAISLAVRTDFSDAFDSKTIWKFGVRQPLPAGLYVRANGGTSYSLPRTNELFSNIPPPVGFTGLITAEGNPDLAPEETETYNAGFGIENTFGDIGLSAEIGGFYTDITSRISTFTVDNPLVDVANPALGRVRPGFAPTYSTWFNNTAVTEIRGLTAEVNLTLGDQWRFNAAYTSQDASENAGSRKGMQLGETPAWFATGIIEWTSKDERFIVQLMPRLQGAEWATGGPAIPGTTRPANVGSRTPADTGVSRYRHNFGDYAVVNGTLTYRAGEQLQHRFTFRVVNIFDEYYAERYGFGTQQYGSAFNRGEFTTTDDRYYFGYPFEGKPRSFFLSYSTNF